MIVKESNHWKNQISIKPIQREYLLVAMKTLVKYEIIKSIEPDSEETWIEWFCKKKGHEFLCEVEKNFIEDLNLEDVKGIFTHFKQTLDYIMDYERDSETLFSKAS